MSIKKGDTVIIEFRLTDSRSRTESAVVESVGPRWITTMHGRFCADGTIQGRHRMEPGTGYAPILWESQAHYDAEKARRDDFRLLRAFGVVDGLTAALHSGDPVMIRKMAEVAGIEVPPVAGVVP